MVFTQQTVAGTGVVLGRRLWEWVVAEGFHVLEECGEGCETGRWLWQACTKGGILGVKSRRRAIDLEEGMRRSS